MNEQLKYDVIKSLVDHPDSSSKNRAALTLGCSRRTINRLIRGYKDFETEPSFLIYRENIII